MAPKQQYGAAILRPTVAALTSTADNGQEGDVVYLTLRGDCVEVMCWGVICAPASLEFAFKTSTTIVPYDGEDRHAVIAGMGTIAVPHGWCVRTRSRYYVWWCRCFIVQDYYGSKKGPVMRYSVTCLSRTSKQIFHAASGGSPREALAHLGSIMKIPRTVFAERLFGLAYEATQLAIYYRSERVEPRSGTNGAAHMGAWIAEMHRLTAVQTAEAMPPPSKLRRVTRVVSEPPASRIF